VLQIIVLLLCIKLNSEKYYSITEYWSIAISNPFTHLLLNIVSLMSYDDLLQVLFLHYKCKQIFAILSKVKYWFPSDYACWQTLRSYTRRLWFVIS